MSIDFSLSKIGSILIAVSLPVLMVLVLFETYRLVSDAKRMIKATRRDEFNVKLAAFWPLEAVVFPELLAENDKVHRSSMFRSFGRLTLYLVLAGIITFIMKVYFPRAAG